MPHAGIALLRLLLNQRVCNSSPRALGQGVQRQCLPASPQLPGEKITCGNIVCD